MTEKSVDVREQKFLEVDVKMKHCANPSFECTLPRVEGYDYCMKHILRDCRGNFRQCNFIYNNGRKCSNAVPKYDLKKDPSMTTFCFEHSRQAQLRITHSSVGRHKQLDTNESFLSDLSHHLKVADVEDKVENSEQEEEIDVVSPDLTPFSLQSQVQPFNEIRESRKNRRRILDYASDSSVDEEPPSCATTFQEYDFRETDDESIDSDDDPLKNAGIYTSEEVVKITLKKYTKLKSLYQRQFSYLQHLLKEKRRRYLIEARKEKETLCNIDEQVKDTAKERKAYREMKALSSYHRRHGQEAVLYRKFKEKRNRLNDTYNAKAPSFVKCIHSEGGVKCRERVIPCSKYCRKHILEDKKQVLFRACKVERSGVICQEPVPCIFEDSACILHMAIPRNQQFIPKKFDSDTEEEPATIKTENADKPAETNSVPESNIKEEQPDGIER